jgi:hypothetical protein
MTILELYNAKAEIAAAPGLGAGGTVKSFNAKNVGTDAAATDEINGSVRGQSWDVAQRDFKIKQPLLQTQFTEKGLNYAEVLKVNTTKYAPSGRL